MFDLLENVFSPMHERINKHLNRPEIIRGKSPEEFFHSFIDHWFQSNDRKNYDLVQKNTTEMLWQFLACWGRSHSSSLSSAVVVKKLGKGADWCYLDFSLSSNGRVDFYYFIRSIKHAHCQPGLSIASISSRQFIPNMSPMSIKKKEKKKKERDSISLNTTLFGYVFPWDWITRSFFLSFLVCVCIYYHSTRNALQQS